MFGLNGWEIPALVLLALLFFGSKKLPELAKGLGESMRTVKKEIQNLSDDTAEIQDELDSVKESVKIRPSKKNATKKSVS